MDPFTPPFRYFVLSDVKQVLPDSRYFNVKYRMDTEQKEDNGTSVFTGIPLWKSSYQG